MPKLKHTSRVKTATDEDIRKIAAHFAKDSDGDDAYMYGDDEDIDENEAFDAEDEKKWGSIVNPIVKRTKAFAGVAAGKGVSQIVDDSQDEVSDDGEDDDDEDMTGARYAAGESGDEDVDSEEDAVDGAEQEGDEEGEEEEEEEDASDDTSEEDEEDDEEDDENAVTLMDVFDVNTARDKNLPKQQSSKAALSDDEEGDSEDDEEEDDDDEEEEEDDNEELTEAQRDQLLKYIQQLDGSPDAAADKARGPKRMRVKEQSADGAEHQFAATSSGGGLTLTDLMGSLSGSAQFGGLKERLERLINPDVAAGRKRGRKEMAGPLAAPPSAVVQARADRAEAYMEVRQNVSKWTDLVQINRQAPHLSFSAEAQGKVGDRARGLTTSSLAADFRPSNELEAAIAEAIASSGMGIGRSGATSDASILNAEKAEFNLVSRMHKSGGHDPEVGEDGLPTANFDAEAFERRQHELAKMRALLFYDEIKRKRQNKIKSKAYRRLKGRVDTKRGAAERDELRKRDPAAAALLDEAEAKILAKERMTLKHRAGKGIGGSKWVKRVLSQGGGGGDVDAETKQSMVDHLKRAQDLQKRMRAAKEQEAVDSDSDGLDADFADAAGPKDVVAAARKRILADVGITEDGEELDATGPSARNEAGKYAFQEVAPSRTAQAGDDKERGIMSMRFMKNAALRARDQARKEAIEAAEELTNKEKSMRGGKHAPKDDYSSDEDDAHGDYSDDDDAPAPAASEPIDFDHSAVATEADGPTPSLSTATKKGKKNGGKAGAAAAVEATGRKAFAGPDATKPSGRVGSGKGTKADKQIVDAVLDGLSANPRKAAKVVAAEPLAAEVPEKRNAWLTQGGVTLSDFAAPNNAKIPETASNPWLADNAFNSGAQTSGNTATAVATSRTGATKRAQASLGGGNTLDIAAGMNLMENAAKAAKKANSAAENAQAELIRRAFAGAGATVEELAEEKDEEEKERVAAAEAKKPSKGRTQEDLANAAGWGTWAGLGAASAADQLAAAAKAKARRVGSKLASSVAQNKPAAAKAALPQRKDAHLANVVISEKRDKKLAKQFQVSSVPFPFQTKEQYERSLRQPVGPEWNTSQTVADLTKPEVVTRAGVIINPIQYVKVKRGKALSKDGGPKEAASAVASAGARKDKRR